MATWLSERAGNFCAYTIVQSARHWEVCLDGSELCADGFASPQEGVPEGAALEADLELITIRKERAPFNKWQIHPIQP